MWNLVGEYAFGIETSSNSNSTSSTTQYRDFHYCNIYDEKVPSTVQIQTTTQITKVITTTTSIQSIYNRSSELCFHIATYPDYFQKDKIDMIGRISKFVVERTQESRLNFINIKSNNVLREVLPFIISLFGLETRPEYLSTDLSEYAFYLIDTCTDDNGDSHYSLLESLMLLYPATFNEIETLKQSICFASVRHKPDMLSLLLRHLFIVIDKSTSTDSIHVKEIRLFLFNWCQHCLSFALDDGDSTKPHDLMCFCLLLNALKEMCGSYFDSFNFVLANDQGLISVVDVLDHFRMREIERQKSIILICTAWELEMWVNSMLKAYSGDYFSTSMDPHNSSFSSSPIVLDAQKIPKPDAKCDWITPYEFYNYNPNENIVRFNPLGNDILIHYLPHETGRVWLRRIENAFDVSLLPSTVVQLRRFTVFCTVGRKIFRFSLDKSESFLDDPMTKNQSLFAMPNCSLWVYFN